MLRKMDRLEAALRDIRDMKAEELHRGTPEQLLEPSGDSK